MSSFNAKCVVLGAPYVDISKFLMQYITGPSENDDLEVIGCQFGTTRVKIDTQIITLHVWNLSTAERFRNFWTGHCRGASCAILAFDLSRPESFKPRIQNLMNEIFTDIGMIPILLLGCKNKLDAPQKIPEKEISALCESIPNIAYLEIDSDPQHLFLVMATITFLMLRKMEVNDEKIASDFINLQKIIQNIRFFYEKRTKRLKTLISILKNMNLTLNENDEVEILTNKGLFLINIFTGHVGFLRIKCLNCRQQTCLKRINTPTKSLCIIPAGEGWSNSDLEKSEILTLSKIIAITNNTLPSSVLTQIQNIHIRCS